SAEDGTRTFELKEVPFRINLYRLDRHRYRMDISNHHILYDGWSTGIILREFLDAYRDFSRGKSPQRFNKTKFKKFVGVRKPDYGLLSKAEKFWQNALKECTQPAALPIKNQIPTAGTGFTHYWQAMEEPVYRTSQQLTASRKVTAAALVYTAWAVLLQKYGGASSVLFGTTVSGRDTTLKGIENMVGLFINTLPLTVRTAPGQSGINLLEMVDRQLRERTPFNKNSLGDILKSCGVKNRDPLFDTVVVVENYPLDQSLAGAGGLFSIDTHTM
ncbi:MAG: hypothetical protein GY765_39025, partial [bacterium]|nr:hypothetical protein [bacterium]